ncbi:hypothetical protein ACFU9X_22185, partial [Streptomyces atratus]
GAGLNLFITNVAEHLKTGVVSWLLGTAVKAGLELPQKFDLKGIIQLIASLLGLTWANIRARITRKGIPDQAMTAVETSVPVAKKLATEGPAGAVKEITAEAGDLKATILEKLTSYLIPTVIIAGITWIISLLNPASAFVRAVKGIIDIVTFIVNQGAQIAEFVNAVLDSVIAIANGGTAGVPKMIETALATSVPLLIGFLASLLGIGSLANKVKSVFHAVAKPVNRAIDKIVSFITKKGKALWQRLKKDSRNEKTRQGEGKKDPSREERLQSAIEAARSAMKRRGASIESIESEFVKIKARHRLTKLELVKDDNHVYHPLATINPTAHGGTAKLFTEAELVELQIVADGYSRQVREKGPEEIARFNANPRKYLLPHPGPDPKKRGKTKVTIGSMVESAAAPGFRELARTSNLTLLENLQLQFVDASGANVGGAQNELDFVLLGKKGIEEVISAKFAPGSFKISRDKAIVNHFYKIPVGPPGDILQYIRKDLKITSPVYQNVNSVDIEWSNGRQPLNEFRQKHLTEIPVDKVRIKAVVPASPDAAPDMIQLKASQIELVDKIIELMKHPL